MKSVARSTAKPYQVFTDEQIIRMSEAFPGKLSIQIEELRFAEKKESRCFCGNTHEKVIRPAGFYVDGVLVSEKDYREIEQKLRWVIDGDKP